MTTGVIDTTVIIHLYRRNTAAQLWLQNLVTPLSITPITWLEVMFGAPGKSGQAASKLIMSQFELIYLTPADMDWAMHQMEQLRLSRGVSLTDCLIAAVAYRLNIPLYTHNMKDMTALLGNRLAVQPY